MSAIDVRGARAHNLQQVDLRLEQGRWHAVTGWSGSGKSTLVFDTLVREGQRRFLGSLSPRARMVFGKLGEAQVDAIEGLPPAMAVGQGRVASNPRSTVATLTGVLDLLRLWFAREGRHPQGQRLSRAHYSFNSLGACESCQGLGVEDRVEPSLVVADGSRSIRDGALVPTLKNGYTVYSQVTLQVMNDICRAHGFDVDTPWDALTDAQRDVILYGTDALVVPFGKHSIESRMKWKGITARPREEGHYRGLIPVITETLKRSRNPNILRFVRSVPCSVCEGSRFAEPARVTRIGAHTLPSLLALPVGGLGEVVAALPRGPVGEAVRVSLQTRLARLGQLGLGHLSLDRSSTTLSAGEGQRVRLVSQLSTELSGFLLALDEPTLGLHPTAAAGMAQVLDEAVERGNTVVVVEHEPDLARRADSVVQLGPGAGPAGGRVVYQGDARGHDWGDLTVPVADRGEPEGWMRLEGARLHNLHGDTLAVPLARFTVVQGPSGAGKSSLVFGSLLPAAQAGALPGAPSTVQAVDATPIGRTPRSTPATWSGLFERIRKAFAATAEAKARGWGASRFSFNTKAGRCGACEGLGVERIGLHLMTDVERACPTCGGTRYTSETLEVRWHGMSIAEVLRCPVDQALQVFAAEPALAPTLQAMADLGLGYLQLGQSSTTLSRGEAQRIKLATLLGAERSTPSLVVLDEPDRGLHPADVRRLLQALHRLVDRGHTVLAVSHHRSLWASADHLVGVRDGRIVPGSTDAPELPWRTRRAPVPPPSHITLEGVRTHNLDLDVRIPRGALTVVAGVSGSGKSSLVFDTLAAESWHRFAESLPFEVRRHVRQLPRAAVEAVGGIGPTLALGQSAAVVGRRSTVGTLSTLDAPLRLLWSRAGGTDLSAEHFSPNRPLGACSACEGLGTVPRCSEARLFTHPDAPLFAGAMAGTRAGRFFGEADGRFQATLRTVAPQVDWDVPWSELSPDARRLAMEGAGDTVVSVRWTWTRGKRSGEHSFEGPWEGLAMLVENEARVRARAKAAAEWAEPLVDQPCEVCAGHGLSEASREARVGGHRIGEARGWTLRQLRESLEEGPLATVRRVLCRGLDGLISLGLGHLSLNRRGATLSSGELQRLRLASVLQSGLAGLTLLLDEPAAGLHAHETQALLEHLRELVGAGHTVVVVSHRPAMIRGADHLLELGPGAGDQGGRVVYEGPPQALAGTVTAQALTQSSEVRTETLPCPMALRGVQHRNLDLDLHLPASGLVAVSGVSGSGKSTLVFEVLARSVESGRPVGCASTMGLERFGAVARAQAEGGTVMRVLGLGRAVQGLFHGAQVGDLPKRAFSAGSPAGRCGACGGRGRVVVSMDVLADLRLPCESCAGTGFGEEVRAVRWEGLDMGGFLECALGDLPDGAPRVLRHAAEVLASVGLGHLSLGRRRRELSGGEQQRLALASCLLQPRLEPTLVVLDEPARGLHEADVLAVVQAMRTLADAGHLVVVTAHRLSVLRAADHVVDLGPGAGPEGGRLVASGAPGSLLEGGTAEVLRRATSG